MKFITEIGKMKITRYSPICRKNTAVKKDIE